jgi:hypothetical protein
VPDKYLEWLGIPESFRPPTHYQLLGISPGELDTAAIASAAERQLDRLRPYESSPEADECRRITQEIIKARNTLLDPVERQRYDILTPVPVDPWWNPQSAPPSETPAVPVEGWWQGQTPEPLPPPIESPQGTPTDPASSAPPLPLEAGLPPPKPDDWWKASAPDPTVVVPQSAVVAAESSAPPPPPPVPPPQPPAEHPPPRPIVSEKAMAFPTESGNGPLTWIIAGLVAVAAVGGGVLAWKPWTNSGPAQDTRPIVQAPPNKDDPAPPPKNGDDADPIEFDIGPQPRIVDDGQKKGPEIGKIDPKPKEDIKLPAAPDVSRAMTFQGHKGSVYGVAVNRTALTILSISDDRTVLHYSPREPEKHGVIHKLISPGVAVTFCNEDRDAVFCDGGDIVVYDISERKPKASFENPRGGIRCMAAARDGRFVLTGATDGCVRFWNVAAKNLAHTLDIDEKAAVTAVAIAPDSRTAVIGLSDGRMCVWDLQKQRELKRWKAHAGAVNALAYSPDGQRIVSAGDDGVASIWQPSGTLVRKLSGHKEALLAAVWGPDGRRVFTAGIDRQVRLWDESKGWTGELIKEMPEKVFSLAIDAQGRFILVGLSGGTVRLIPLQ